MYKENLYIAFPFFDLLLCFLRQTFYTHPKNLLKVRYLVWTMLYHVYTSQIFLQEYLH